VIISVIITILAITVLGGVLTTMIHSTHGILALDMITVELIGIMVVNFMDLESAA
jgi:hypothetical protein